MKKIVKLISIALIHICLGSSPCCLYIDDHGRVYKDWNDYKENNKSPKGVLVLPKNGTYNFREIEINVCVVSISLYLFSNPFDILQFIFRKLNKYLLILCYPLHLQL